VALALVAQNNLLLIIQFGLAQSFATHNRLIISPFPGEKKPRLCYTIILHDRNKKNRAHAWLRQLVDEDISKTLTELNVDIATYKPRF
jgi:hypothetical protein